MEGTAAQQLDDIRHGTSEQVEVSSVAVHSLAQNLWIRIAYYCTYTHSSNTNTLHLFYHTISKFLRFCARHGSAATAEDDGVPVNRESNAHWH